MDLLRSDQLLEPSLFPAEEKGREAGKRKRVSPRAWGRHITCPSLFSPFARQRSEPHLHPQPTSESASFRAQ